MGSWFNYYKKYVWEWMKGGPIMAPASAAYYTVPFEMEAYGNERNLDYTKNYTLEHVQEGGKYYIKSDRKKFYKSFGGSREWKAYCKTL